MDDGQAWRPDFAIVCREERQPEHAAINSGLYYEGVDGSLIIETLDAPVVCPGEMRLLQFNNTFVLLEGGFHFNLHNNVWGTDFRMWFEEDMKFRFRLTFRSNL